MLSLSEAIVHHHASPRSLERAEDLLQQGAVGQMIQRGDWLQAYVRGSEGDRYLCRILFQGSRLQEADCSCPYSFEGWCKHLAALGVMRIALSSHPDWVLEQARRRAEPILYHKLSRDYDQAVDWVEWCQAAYLEMGQEGEWLAYRAEIDLQYGRQRKLIGLLRERGL